MRVLGLLAAVWLLPVSAQASDSGDLLTRHLYDGTLAQGEAALVAGKDAADPEACFGWSLLHLAGAFEGLARDFYRYGATTPGTPAAAMLLGMGVAEPPAPANLHPEALSYAALRGVLSGFRTALAQAQTGFECGGVAGADFVVPIDVLKLHLDLDGDGKTEDADTLGAFVTPLFGDMGLDSGNAVLEAKARSKGVAVETDGTIGFDAADAVWLAGYSQIVGAQIDLVLAHDFSDFFNAYLHRVFPGAGLPMQEYTKGGMLVMDPDSDAGFADIIAAIHTLNFPVIDRPLLASIPGQLKHATALSRQNWDLIVAETDDNRELLPNPGQTALLPGMPVTAQSIAAWRQTLDTLDQILDGHLLLPHWRFARGFDLKAYFDTAERTDLVMLLTGEGALPFLRDGPIADSASFAAANAVFGDSIFNYAAWFN
ncbi:MAG: hypothetical protein ACOH2L_12155 [Devosia sp.]